ncbi:hypothetical protein DLB52_22275 [Salmonella enterica subsp. salamae]|nr:hypothetical protein [Salmonella enterica subsp. salamae]ECC8833520.1 hypothetical protein [Salmonella enterica subsp. salamae]ECG0680156.1 hypothetical protein [Salmonella enterica subsp. salamae]
MKTFKGLTLEPETAFRQIAVIIEAGMIISVIDSEDSADLSDGIFCVAKKKYAEAAHQAQMEDRKNKNAHSVEVSHE